MGYWENRIARAQDAITQKNLKQIEKQMRKYYATTAQQVIKEFEDTYNKILSAMEDGKTPTPADLYKLDKYWQLQAQLRQELRKLGEKEIALLTKNFETNFFEVYYSFALEGSSVFSTLDKAAAAQMIHSVWVADGKTFSDRVWSNTARLLETLNEELINCAVAGKKTRDLKNKLQERFGISYRRADTLARTELCHIQTEAAKQRYKDYGIKYVEVLVDADAHTCDKCKELEGKKFPVGGIMPLPVHPNERCAIVPVID